MAGRTPDEHLVLAPDEHLLSQWRAGLDPSFVHMNSAGAAPSANAVHKVVVSHLERERQIGGYAAAAELRRQRGDPKGPVAQLIGARAEEIALVESAQVAWAKAFYSLDFRPNDRILCWASEYAGNAVAFLQVAKRTGATLEVLPMRPDGVIDVGALEEALDRKPTKQSAISNQQ